MSDLVERLRDERIWGQTHLRHEAADEIERLRELQKRDIAAARIRILEAEIERLRGALGEIVDCINHHYSRRDIETIAREALEKDDE